MDFGDIWMALGLDLQVLQGAVTHLYRTSPAFSVIEGAGYRLELIIPAVEVRPVCGTLPYRMGIHLVGDLYLGNNPSVVFDAWVRLDPAVVTDPATGIPAGALRFVGVESIKPAFAKDALAAEFADDGSIGKVLSTFTLPLFDSLLASATAIVNPNADPDAPDPPPDPSLFAVDFWLGQPGAIRRPVFTVQGGQPHLELDVGYVTVPALMATVALAGHSPRMVGDPSVVRPGTGLQLVTTKAAFDAKLAVEKAATEGTEVSGFTVDRLDLSAVDGGIMVDGEGHQTGAHATFTGEVVARYEGGTDGHLHMIPAVHTDVDLDTWVVVLSAVGIVLFPIIGLIAVDVLVWGPEAAAPGTVDQALQGKFTQPLVDIGDQLASGFGVDSMPSAAYLTDLWIFDGNLAVAAVALLGSNPTSIHAVTYDVAHLAKPGVRTNRRRPVRSVAEITLESGHTVAPWQAAELVRDGIIDLPHYHAVHQPRARGEWYLRSNPNDELDDNLIR